MKDTFARAFGKPKPATPNAIHFKHAGLEAIWQLCQKDTGAGWYRNRFLYMFGPDLDPLHACLDAWSFLVPKKKRGDRVIVGRNAYGALLVVEGGDSADDAVYVLDPFLLAYESHPNLNFLNLLGAWLPENRLPTFLDDTLYQAWIKVRRKPLEGALILAPKTPFGLGGEMDPANFQEEEIVSYYQTTGPIFAKAYAKMGKAGKKVARKKGAKR
jgi:hypothetical protein